jgi:hypothetical protein
LRENPEAGRRCFGEYYQNRREAVGSPGEEIREAVKVLPQTREGYQTLRPQERDKWM